ncbi:MAG TPA: ATP-grasp domain-containing protein [Bryobacteraceae bacterium]|nr:ATP-grasp domain-containing protein [Bryobacteraceae bacterium]
MKKILLFAATTGYQVRVFADAARAMNLDLVLATDHCHHLDNPWGDDAVAVRFNDASIGMEALAARGPFDGIAAVGDGPAVIAAQAAARLGLRFSPPDAVLAANNKFLAHERFRRAGLNVASYRMLPPDAGPEAESHATRYPCVLKPVSLSASRGVIRADGPRQFVAALERIQKLLKREPEQSIQVEDFIPGRELALEGLVTDGRLQTLALFDKPDPLDGPFFEETIYLTPSREPDAVQTSIIDATGRAVNALGLAFGPVHAEIRVNSRGVWMLEVAARPIGGLCGQVLRFDGDVSLEEIILRHAMGEDVSRVKRMPGAHGVMMIPIPRAGVFTGVEGVDAARRVPGIEDVVITAKEGQMLLPLPEGASYAGFIFARGDSADSADRALRAAHAQLHFQLSTSLPVVR